MTELAQENEASNAAPKISLLMFLKIQFKLDDELLLLLPDPEIS